MTIPNVIHLCYGFRRDLGNRPFSLAHYLTVKSAAEVHRPDAIRFYYKYEPQGPWWERAKPLMELVPIEPPTEIFGFRVRHHAHQADLVRLQLLQEHGGIYLDMDVLSVKPFGHLLDHPVVLGQEGVDGIHGLCNAVILARPGAFLIERWLEGFDPERSLWQGFRSQGADAHWGEMAVRYPAMLAERYPQHVEVLGHRAFFWPDWTPTGLQRLFERQGDCSDETHCIHLWEQRSWMPYLRHLTVESIRREDTHFNLLARRFLDDVA